MEIRFNTEPTPFEILERKELRECVKQLLEKRKESLTHDSEEWAKTLEALKLTPYQTIPECICQKNWPTAIIALYAVLRQHSSLGNDLVAESALLAEAAIYESQGKYLQALDTLEEPLFFWKVNQASLKQNISPSDVNAASYWLSLYQAGLLLLSNQPQEAKDLLKEHQPFDATTALFYRILEQKLQTPLLISQPVTNEEDLNQLFLAQRYDEVIQKMREQGLDTFDDKTIYAAALAMLGRWDEVFTKDQELREDLEDSFDSHFTSSWLYLLAGHPKEEAFNNEARTLIEIWIPIRPMTQWLLSKTPAHA